MPKTTLIFLLFLIIIATLLIGVQIGRKTAGIQIQSPIDNQQLTVSPSTPPSPSINIQQSIINNSKNSTYTDASCGYSFSIPTGFVASNTTSGSSTILTDTENSSQTIIAACEVEIPKPPLPPDKIEDITLDGVDTILYHDTDSQTGKPRDEIIVRHPTNRKEIILAGFGTDFETVLSSFRFITK